jgi:hypothetical protein
MYRLIPQIRAAVQKRIKHFAKRRCKKGKRCKKKRRAGGGVSAQAR